LPGGAHIYAAHDHPWGVRMPHAKFSGDLVETVVVHKEQANRQADLAS